MLRKSALISIIATCCVLILGLSLLAYIGFYNRYWGDDWCYNRDFKNLGIGGTLGTYFSTGQDALRGYSTNRYSLTLISGLLYLPGMFGNQIIAALVIVLWLIGLLWVFSNLSRLHGHGFSIVTFLAAAFLLYYVLYLSPQRFQVLYWRSGVHYSFTIITGLYLIGLITSQMIRNKTSNLYNYIIAVLAFIAGGLSETGCVYLVSAAAVLLAATWYWKRKNASWATKSYAAILITFISLLVSMIVLILSPSNSRADTIPAKSASFLLVPLLSLKFSLSFIFDSIKSLPIPHFIFIIFFVCLGAIFEFLSTVKRTVSFKEVALFSLITAVIVFLLITAIQAPTVRFYSTYPEPRVQSLSRFTMLAGLAAISWIAGLFIFSRWDKHWFIGIAMLGVALSAIYTARLITTNYADLPAFVSRAQLWDQRDQAIRTAEALGLKQVDVLVIDTHDLAVQDIMRSKDMTGKWVSTCGSDYYGLDAIRAAQP